MSKTIQWNIRRARVNYCESLLLITKYWPAIICLQETQLKNNTSFNTKNYYSHNYIKQNTYKLYDGSSIIINDNILHSNASCRYISNTPQKNNSVFNIYSLKWITQGIGAEQVNRTTTKTLWNLGK